MGGIAADGSVHGRQNAWKAECMEGRMHQRGIQKSTSTQTSTSLFRFSNSLLSLLMCDSY